MRHTTLLATVFLGLALSGAAEAGKKKKKKKKKKKGEEVVDVVGWHTAEEALGACYHPPKWEELGIADERRARSEALAAIMGQWKGDRGDGIAMDETAIGNVETVLLGYPEKIPMVVQQNLEHCQAAMSGKGTSAWESWLVALPKKLVAGECRRPLDVTMFWYLDIGQGWQGNASVCEGDPVRVVASAQDEYRVDDKGPWINAGGDTSKPTTEPGLPCTIEGCFAGQLVLRFRGESGVEIVKPVGTELVFTPPEHGVIEFTINDNTYYNNEWKVERGMQHHTSVTYEPVEN